MAALAAADLARTLGVEPQFAALARDNGQQPIGFPHIRPVHDDGFNAIETDSVQLTILDDQ
jgi:hypothetical protein